MNNRRKFVLIDPSFDGTKGDKLQYAMAFFDSSVANDFDFILLANRASPPIDRIAGRVVDQRNIFSHGFYDHGRIVARAHSSPKRQKLKFADQRFNAKFASIENEIQEKRAGGKQAEAARLKIYLDNMLKEHEQTISSLIQEIQNEEPDATPFNRDDFAESMVEQIKLLSLKNGDVLFLHTTTQAMLESLTEISVRLADDETIDVDAYFLFHFGVEASDARTFVNRYYSFAHFESIKLRLSTGSPFRRVHLIATSETLRDEIEKLSGLPVGLFDGLCNFDRYLLAAGGPDNFEAIRSMIMKKLHQREVAIGVRTADLDDNRFDELLRSVQLLRSLNISVELRIAYHDGNWARAAGFAARSAANINLIDTNQNDDYICFLANSSIVVLPYNPDIYEKRVSAVLHDCAIMGISCVVPTGTTLADASEFADIYQFSSLPNIPGAILRAVTNLIESPTQSVARRDRAMELLGSDVITRLLKSTPEPSVTVAKRGPVATVIMPFWGRVGSTCIFDAQIQFLLEQGYFVVQVFSFDKQAEITKVSEFFWRLLYEGSQTMRGSVQRVAFRLEDYLVEKLPTTANAYDSYEANFGENSLWDDLLLDVTRKSTVTIVNHVFNTRLARKIGNGKFILESHDIQSAQMVKWPLRNPFTGQADPFDQLLSREMKSISTYDYVINISSVEHTLLKHANQRSRVLTPYIACGFSKPKYESISAMSFAHGWDSSYRDIFQFDLILVGDSHPANLESAIWFIEKVYKPFLIDRSIRVGIVGRVSYALWDKFGALPNIYYCGFVDDLNSVRFLSRVAVLPDQRGSGISIKTLETLAYGDAFVATSMAFRGLADQLLEQPPIHDEPHAFAERVIELLGDENQRVQLELWAARASRVLSGKEIYDAALRDVFIELRLPINQIL